MSVIVLVRRVKYEMCGSKSKKYLEAKINAGKAVYQASCKVEKNRFGGVRVRGMARNVMCL